MTDLLRDCEELILLDNVLWMLSATAGAINYDFPFAKYFSFERAWELPSSAQVVARIGAFEDYAARYNSLASVGLQLVNNPDQHNRASRLPYWYPLLQDLTPRSRWYDEPPTVAEVEREFTWPVFVKGERQTSKHSRKLSIANSPTEFAEILEAYQQIPLLKWQRITVREFVALRRIEDVDRERLPTSYEFRTFWWRGRLVGIGQYWFQGKHYELSKVERHSCLKVAEEAANRVDVPFLVVDVAQRENGQWIVIECNDAQESGYSAINPVGLWQQVITLEKSGNDPNKRLT